MDRNPHKHVAGSPASWPDGAPALWGVGPLFEPHVDRNALDRMLLALAVHRDGPGFERAHLLLWAPARRVLEGRLSWSKAGAARPLAETLAIAQRQASEGTDAEATRRLRAFGLALDDLEPLLGDAYARGAVAIGDVGEGRMAPWRSGEHLGVIALRRGTGGYGLIVGEWLERAPAAERMASLEAVRRLGDAALGLLSEAEEGRRAAHQAAALAELTRAAVSPLNLAEALQTLVRLAAQGSAARGSALWLSEPDGTLVLETAHGPSGTKDRLGHALQSIATDAHESGRGVSIDRALDDPRLTPDDATLLNAVALYPLAAYGRSAGVMAIYDRAVFHPGDTPAFDPTDQQFLATLSDLGALILEQARRSAELKQGHGREQDLQRRVARHERLAAVGEMAARVAQDTRNPLASIGAFARRVHRLLQADDPHREYLEVVIREAERLERIMGEQAQLAAPERPRLKLESLNQVVQHSLQGVGDTLVRRRVRLLKKLAPELPELLLDADRIRRVMDNILASALDEVAPGGRIRVESRQVQQHVVVDVANDGARAPGELLSQLFVPFASGGPAGRVGLAVASQIVRQHGGEIRVRSEAEWSTIFSFTLPIRDNQDRRRVRSDRRASHRDRRERFPAT